MARWGLPQQPPGYLFVIYRKPNPCKIAHLQYLFITLYKTLMYINRQGFEGVRSDSLMSYVF